MAIGALVFFMYSIVTEEDVAAVGNRIIVTTGDIERISSNWSKKWSRPPAVAELEALVDAYIREEVYYREALALGLDRDDLVVRRRLMQKMEFLSNDLAELTTPDESALKEYLSEHSERYQLLPRVTFTHLYFSPDRKGDKAAVAARSVLAAINADPATVRRASERGDPIMLPRDFRRETAPDVARLFGDRFAAQLFQQPVGIWRGPISSGYGFHLVRIEEMSGPQMPELNSIIEKVRADWMYEKRQELNTTIYEKFKQRYEILVEGLPSSIGRAEAAANQGGG